MDSTDLQHLRRLAIFAKVVKQGSFAGAARELGMSRSGISEQISLLETALSARLLHRTTHKLTLTQEGEIIYPQAADLLKTFNNIANSIDTNDSTGRIRITTGHDFAEIWLNPRLKQFHQEYPDVYFDLILSDNEIDLVSNRIDLAVRITSNPKDSLLFNTLFQDQLVLIASNDFCQRHGKNPDISVIQESTWILMNQFISRNKVTLRDSKSNKSIRFEPDSYHLCSSPSTMKDMVMSDIGISLYLPKLMENELKSGKLKIIKPNYHSETLTFFSTYPSKQQIPARVRSLLDFLAPTESDIASS